MTNTLTLNEEAKIKADSKSFYYKISMTEFVKLYNENQSINPYPDNDEKIKHHNAQKVLNTINEFNINDELKEELKKDQLGIKDTFVTELADKVHPLFAFFYLFAGYNYQTCNGGHDQYYDNGVASDDGGGCFRSHDDDISAHHAMVDYAKIIEQEYVFSDKLQEFMKIIKAFVVTYKYSDCDECDGDGTYFEEYDDEDDEDNNGALGETRDCEACNGLGKNKRRKEWAVKDSKELDDRYFAIYEVVEDYFFTLVSDKMTELVTINKFGAFSPKEMYEKTNVEITNKEYDFLKSEVLSLNQKLINEVAKNKKLSEEKEALRREKDLLDTKVIHLVEEKTGYIIRESNLKDEIEKFKKFAAEEQTEFINMIEETSMANDKIKAQLKNAIDVINNINMDELDSLIKNYK